MVELGMLLDFLDALAGAVAIAFWWCTWVGPGKQAPRLHAKAHPSEPSEVDRFLLDVRDCPRSAATSVMTSVARSGPQPAEPICREARLD